MTDTQVKFVAQSCTFGWMRVAACATAVLYVKPAFAHEEAETKQNSVDAFGDQSIPEVGFAAAGKCRQVDAQQVTTIASGLGRLGGFDLGKMGTQIDSPSLGPRFGQRVCEAPLSAKRRAAPVAPAVSLAVADIAESSRQLSTPGAGADRLDSQPAASKDAFSGTYALIGVSVGSIPTYEGSRSSKIMPVPGALGRVGGVDFRLAGPSLTLDFIKGKPNAKVGLALGPAVRYRFNRSGKTGDPVVDQLGKLKSVIELGVSTGVTVKRVLTKYDLLSVSVSARWDVSGRGSGMIASASASYLLPVSKAQVVGALVSADFVDKRYAKYNYSVSPAGSAASGLPVYTGKGGFKSASVGAFTARDLNGNILDGGFAIGVGAMYTKLFGSAARTPITALRGKRSQWIFGGGLIYTF